MNEQEREEQDFNPQSEAVNCLEEAVQALQPTKLKVLAKANRLAEDGFHVVLEHSPVFCKATDAACGMAIDIIAACTTREKAESILGGMEESQTYHPEGYVEILSKTGGYLPPNPAADEDLPF